MVLDQLVVIFLNVPGKKGIFNTIKLFIAMLIIDGLENNGFKLERNPCKCTLWFVLMIMMLIIAKRLSIFHSEMVFEKISWFEK